jgi:hypothetical protein
MVIEFGGNDAAAYTITTSPAPPEPGGLASGPYVPLAPYNIGMSITLTGLLPSTAYTFTYTLYANSNFTGPTASLTRSNTTTA